MALPPTLPNWTPREEAKRPTAEEAENAENTEQTLTYAGANSIVPIVWGEQIVGGPVIAGPVEDTGYLVYAVALCWAGDNGIGGVEDVRLGESLDTVTVITDPNIGSGGSVGSHGYTVYDGRQTAANSRLSSAIAGFDDTFEGLAYAVIRVSTSKVSSALPQITFRIKGRKCRDPRDNTVKWTENPALHMLDFVENGEFGLGRSIVGAIEAADLADSLYSGLKRARTGLCIQDPMTEKEIISQLAEYAEVLWSYDGESVTVIPDAPADKVYRLNANYIREGSLTFSTEALDQIPTSVQVEFTDRDNTSPWQTLPAVAELEDFRVDRSPSSVPLPGVYSRLEAERRAQQRLNRLQVPGKVEWQMFAPGVKFQAGDVVEIPDTKGAKNLEVRLTAQPEMVAPLVYQMRGEIYQIENYPLGADGLAIPTGAILLSRPGEGVPDGWEVMDTGDRLIREGVPGEAGSLDKISYTFRSTRSGSHVGDRAPGSFFMYSQDLGLGTNSGHIISKGFEVESGEHSHSWGVSENPEKTVKREGFKLTKLTGSPRLLPEGLSLMSFSDILDNTTLVKDENVSGYLTGVKDRSELEYKAEEDHSPSGGSHNHGSQSPRAIFNRGNYDAWQGVEAGEHQHRATTTFNSELRSVALRVFNSLGQAAIPYEGVVGWEGDVAPEGWGFCDGKNGTVDLREYFIFLTSSGEVGSQKHGNSSYSLYSGSLSYAGDHSHTWRVSNINYTHVGNNPKRMPIHHNETGGHTHSVDSEYYGKSGSLDDIKRYQLRFIQPVKD